jgi:hypothetical protein
MPQTMEPVRTIYTEEWVRARCEVEQRILGPFSGALAQLEEAWEHVRPLELWIEERASGALGEAEDALRWHVEVEVVDLFRWIANETLLSIPRPEKKQVAASVDDLETEIEALRRNLRIFLLAVRARGVPRSVRGLAAEHGAPLVDWSIAFGGTAAAIRRYLDSAGIGEE